MARNLHHRHDRFMQSILGDITMTRQYVDAFLPDSLKKMVGLEKLEHPDKSFVSDTLKVTLVGYRNERIFSPGNSITVL